MKIIKTYQLPFPVDAVFSAWTSSKTVIEPATRMEIEPVIGGCYRLFVDTAEYKSSNEGVFLEIIPNRLLKYSWEWNNDGEVSEIEVIFRPNSSGTKILLIHSGFSNKTSLAMHDSGWDSYIIGLENFIANNFPS